MDHLNIRYSPIKIEKIQRTLIKKNKIIIYGKRKINKDKNHTELVFSK